MSYKSALLVIYGFGSLTPSRLVQAAAQNECEPVFVLPGTAHAQKMKPMLELLGSVIDLSEHTEDELISEIKRFNPAGITTFSEINIETTARLAERLGLPYHLPTDIAMITRKDAQRRRLSETDVDTVRFRAITDPRQVTEALEYVGLPAILKPARGAGSRNTVLVTTESECRHTVAEWLPSGQHDNSLTETVLILEEFLAGRPIEPPWGDYIAANCVAFGEDVHPMFVSSKFGVAAPFRERGGYGGASIVPQPELNDALALACRAVRALNIRAGITDVEVKLTDSGPKIIEVNGRLGGWVDDLAMRSQGTDVADIAVKCALGLRPEIPPLRRAGPIAFHYVVIPPFDAKQVRSLHGVPRLRRLRFVEHVEIHKNAGAPVDWRHGTDSGVASVLGRTDTHAQLAEVVTAIEETDWISYE